MMMMYFMCSLRAQTTSGCWDAQTKAAHLSDLARTDFGAFEFLGQPGAAHELLVGATENAEKREVRLGAALPRGRHGLATLRMSAGPSLTCCICGEACMSSERRAKGNGTTRAITARAMATSATCTTPHAAGARSQS